MSQKDASSRASSTGRSRKSSASSSVRVSQSSTQDATLSKSKSVAKKPAVPKAPRAVSKERVSKVPALPSSNLPKNSDQDTDLQLGQGSELIRESSVTLNSERKSAGSPDVIIKATFPKSPLGETTVVAHDEPKTPAGAYHSPKENREELDVGVGVSSLVSEPPQGDDPELKVFKDQPANFQKQFGNFQKFSEFSRKFSEKFWNFPDFFRKISEKNCLASI